MKSILKYLIVGCDRIKHVLSQLLKCFGYVYLFLFLSSISLWYVLLLVIVLWLSNLIFLVEEGYLQ